MWSHYISQNMPQYHLQSVDQNMASTSSCSKVATSLTSFYDRINIMSCKKEQCHWLPFAIVFHVVNSDLTKASHYTYFLFVLQQQVVKRFLKRKIFTTCCFGTGCNVYVRTERTCYLLPVINSMKSVESPLDNTEQYVTNFLLLIELCLIT